MSHRRARHVRKLFKDVGININTNKRLYRKVKRMWRPDNGR